MLRKIMSQQHAPKKLGQGHLYHCVSSIVLLTTAHKHLEV